MVFYNGGLDVGVVPWGVEQAHGASVDDEGQIATNVATYPAGVIPSAAI